MGKRDTRGRDLRDFLSRTRWLERARKYEQEIAEGATGRRSRQLAERALAIRVQLGLPLDGPLPAAFERPTPLFKGDVDARGKSVSKRLSKLTRAKPTTKRAQERMRLSIYRASVARARKRKG